MMKTKVFISLISFCLPVLLNAQTYKTVEMQQPGWILVPNSDPIWVQTNSSLGQWGPVLDRPFSGKEIRTTTQTLADGTHIQKDSRSIFYRDSHGRMRSESPACIILYDSIAGFIYVLNTKSRQYTKEAVSEKSSVKIAAGMGGSSTTAMRTNQSLQGAQTETLPPQVIQGMKVTGTRTTITIPVGTFGNDRQLPIANERWYSEDLKALVKSSNTDPRFGTTTYELTDIVQAPPDPALFQLPGDYMEKEPQKKSSH